MAGLPFPVATLKNLCFSFAQSIGLKQAVIGKINPLKPITHQLQNEAKIQTRNNLMKQKKVLQHKWSVPTYLFTTRSEKVKC